MSDSTKLSLTARDPEGSRCHAPPAPRGQRARRHLRRRRRAVAFAVDARILRNTLAHSGAILEITIDGGTPAPGARQGPPAPPGARRDHARGLPPREHERDDPDDGRARAHRRRRAPGRRRGRRALPGDARAQHRGAPGRHPGRRSSTTCRRCEINDDADALRDHRARRASRSSTTSRRPSSPRSPRRRSSRSRTRSRPRPSSWARTAQAAEGEARRRRRGPSAAADVLATSPEGLRLRTRRLADRRAREPRARLRGHAAQRRLQGRRRAGAPLGPPARQEEVRGRAGRGPHRPGRPARRACSSRRPS